MSCSASASAKSPLMYSLDETVTPGLHALAALIDEQTGRYRELNGAAGMISMAARSYGRSRPVGAQSPVGQAIRRKVYLY